MMLTMMTGTIETSAPDMTRSHSNKPNPTQSCNTSTPGKEHKKKNEQSYILVLLELDHHQVM